MEELLKQIQMLDKSKKEIEEQIKSLKQEVESQLTEDGFKNDFVTISYTKPSKTVTIDLALLEEKETDLFDDLLKDYPKVSERKGSYNYRFKS